MRQNWIEPPINTPGKTRVQVLCWLFLLVIVSEPSTAKEKFRLDDFSMSLEKITSDPNHTWVNSGNTTVSPEFQTVMGVNDFYAPPLAATGFHFGMEIDVDGTAISDKLNYGKGDVGLLYSGGTWYPHKIVREGTYHHLKNGKLVSFGVISELVPLFGNEGFVEKVRIFNRSDRPIRVRLIPRVKPGNPVNLPLENWGFGKPASNQPEAVQSSENEWSNFPATIRLFHHDSAWLLDPGKAETGYFIVTIKPSGIKENPLTDGARLIEQTEKAWKKRLETLTSNVPTLSSDIDGLDDYYKRSVLTGLVCMWEDQDYALNPFPSECGIDGGATCLYPWGIAYVPNMSSLMLGSYLTEVIRKTAAIDLQRHYAITLNGQGIGVKYSYDTYALAVLCDAVFKYFGPRQELFGEVKRLILDDEKRREENFLIDYGVQHNLLEMRGAGWEHFVPSPNAERIVSLKILAKMGKSLGVDRKEIAGWENRAEQIKHAIRSVLWNDRAGWFSCLYPQGYQDIVYSIQVFDVLRTGVCTPDMKKAIISHLRDGAFLADYGVESISKEDKVHHEVVDSDWSGGGAYTGDGPQLALTMYEQNEPEKGWDILRRHFWMGKQLLYYPQEHLVDKPVTPPHKRSAIFAGLAGAEAVLFGLAGFEPTYDGELYINPKLTAEGKVSLTGFGFRGSVFDVSFSKYNMKVIKNGIVIYDGKPKKMKIQG